MQSLLIHLRDCCALPRTFGSIWTVILSIPVFILLGVVNVLTAPAATVNLSPVVAKSILISPVDSGKEINVILSLPLGDSIGAAQFAHRVSNPKDSLYRQYIAPEEFATRYGANVTDFAALREWAIANGLTVVHEACARTFLTVHGTVAQFQTLFKTQLNNYRSADGAEFYSASVIPAIPDAIADKVTGVIGLTNSAQYAPLAKVYKTFGENGMAPAGSTDTAGGTGREAPIPRLTCGLLTGFQPLAELLLKP